MMRRGRILIFLGLILGLGTAVLAYVLLRVPPSPPLEPEEVMTREVVVAVQNVGEGETIIPEAVELREMEKERIPFDAVSNIFEVEGTIARTNIFQGQVIQQAMIVREEDILSKGISPAILIPKGKVAMAFPIDVLSSVSYAIRPGDFVDVLISMEFIDLDEASQTRLPLRMGGPEECEVCAPIAEQIARVATQLIVQDVEVLKVGIWEAAVPPPSEEEEEVEEEAGEEAEEQPPAGPEYLALHLTEEYMARAQAQQGLPEQPQYVTLLVSHQDAAVLKYALESGARLDLVLRSSGDHDIVTTEPVTLDYMLARFGISVPPKRPYTLQSLERVQEFFGELE